MNVIHKPRGLYERYIKRALDVLCSLLALIFLSPIFCLIAILVRIKLGSPVFFSQERVGKNEKIFRLIKFRSMTNDVDEKGNLLPDKERLTSFGKKLRSTSLDELPELFNILKGDMSVIGPRPLPTIYLPYYKKNERIIHSVRGGLIPPDVLSLHPVFDWDEQFQNEIRYVNNISFLNDVKVFFATFIILFKRNNSNYGAKKRNSLIEERKNMKLE